MAAAQHVRTIGRAAHSVAAPVAQTALPAAPGWSGYWTYVVSVIIVMFILYTAQKGTLGTWIGFFSWTSPQPVGSATVNGGTSAIAGAAVGSALTGGSGTGAALGATTGAAASTLQGISNTWGSTMTKIMNGLGIPSGGAFSGSASAGTAGQK